MGTFRGSPQEIKPLSGNGPRRVYVFHGLAEVFRARMVCGVGFYGAFPVVNRRQVDFHILLLSCQHYSRALPSSAAEHIHDGIIFFHALFSQTSILKIRKMQYRHFAFWIVYKPPHKLILIGEAVISSKLPHRNIPFAFRKKVPPPRMANFLYVYQPLHAKHLLFAPVRLPLPHKQGHIPAFNLFPEKEILPDGMDFTGY
jgi:hypothetical protein